VNKIGGETHWKVATLKLEKSSKLGKHVLEQIERWDVRILAGMNWEI
jgi:hypothetical protein